LFYFLFDRLWCDGPDLSGRWIEPLERRNWIRIGSPDAASLTSESAQQTSPATGLKRDRQLLHCAKSVVWNPAKLVRIVVESRMISFRSNAPRAICASIRESGKTESGPAER
jgi:hypothetical protein